MIYDMKNRDYEILSANSADALSVKVKEKLKDGWKQWGSPLCNSMTLDDAGHSLYQAVVKETYDLEDLVE